MVFFFLGIPMALYGQVSIGARGLALGGATVALPDYNWSIFSNPAHLSSNKSTLGFYGLRNYGFAEITDVSAFGSIPTNFGVAAIALHKYGDNLFNETRVRVGYKNEWESLQFGAVLNYNHIVFGSVYGSGGALGIDIGVAAEITQEFWIGAKASNLNHPQYDFSGSSEDLERDLTIGFSYLITEEATFVMDVLKDVRYPVSYRGGLEVVIIQDLKGRVGITIEPLTYSFGFGYEKDFWEVNLAVQQHSLLGLSPGFDLIFSL